MLEEYFVSIGDKKYRGVQILEWLYRHRIRSFDEMTNLSKRALEDLKTHFNLNLLVIEQKLIASDGTTKYLFRLNDQNLIETVLMRHSYGNSVCVTSQVGCNMGCSFCASGELGKVRNLTLSEMIQQVLMVQMDLDQTEERITNIVIMGIGEPFDNYDVVLDFLRLANFQKGLEIGARHMTVSTCGIVPKIKEFANFELQVNLAISLHAATDELRRQIMKINRRYPLTELMPAINEYINKTNRRVTFEYILLKGVNDSPSDAYALVDLIKGMNAYVNLIPYNEVITKDYQKSSHNSAQVFFEILRKNNINATFRIEHGHEVSAACGQLRAQALKRE